MDGDTIDKIGEQLTKYDRHTLICLQEDQNSNLTLYEQTSIYNQWRLIKRLFKSKTAAVIISANNHVFFLIIVALITSLSNCKRIITSGELINHHQSRGVRIQTRAKFLILKTLYHHFLAFHRKTEELFLAKGIPKSTITFFPLIDCPSIPNNEIIESSSKTKRIAISAPVDKSIVKALESIAKFPFPHKVQIYIEEGACTSPELSIILDLSNEHFKIATLTSDELYEFIIQSKMDLFICLDELTGHAEHILHSVSQGIPVICSIDSTMASDTVEPGINGFLLEKKNPKLLSELMKLSLYFTHQKRRKQQAQQIQDTHSPTYRGETLLHLIQRSR